MTDKLEWWIDETSLPDLIWARLQCLSDGSAEIFHADGQTKRFDSVRDAQNALSEDEYVHQQSLDRGDLTRLGMLEREIQPPSGKGAQLLRHIVEFWNVQTRCATWPLLTGKSHGLSCHLRSTTDSLTNFVANSTSAIFSTTDLRAHF